MTFTWNDEINLKPEQFIGFMDCASEHLRPQSIINTIHSLEKQNVIIHPISILRKNHIRVDYLLYVAFDRNDTKFCYKEDGMHEVIFSNVTGLTVTVNAYTQSAVNKYGMRFFSTTFENLFSVTTANKTYSEYITECQPGMITEVKIL